VIAQDSPVQKTEQQDSPGSISKQVPAVQRADSETSVSPFVDL
jgi:hypothetical protein